jgi:hypothetical protein
MYIITTADQPEGSKALVPCLGAHMHTPLEVIGVLVVTVFANWNTFVMD